MPNIDHLVRTDRRLLWAYFGMGVLLLAGSGIAVAFVIMNAASSTDGSSDLIQMLPEFVASVFSLLPFSKCLERYERIGTLLELKRYHAERKRNPHSTAPDNAWVRSMIEKVYEKRLLG